MRQLETKRLILREWKQSDAEDMYSWASSEMVGPMAGWKPHENLQKSQSVIDLFMESNEVYAIQYKENGKVIGSIGIHDRSPDETIKDLKQRELGFVLSSEYWGLGIMPEAVRKCITYAFDELEVDKLWCGHYHDNPQSKKVIEKCGFKFQFTKDGIAKLLDNKKTNTFYYKLDKLKYEKDDKLEYTKQISAGLVSYNEKFTGKKLSESYNVYLLDNDELAGGIQCEMGWDWVFISDLQYPDLVGLKQLMNQVYIQFEEKAVGITYESCVESITSDLIEAGFEITGTLEEMPAGRNTSVLTNMIMKPIDSVNKQAAEARNLIESSEVIEDYNKILSTMSDAFNNKHNIDKRSYDIQYVVFDDSKIIGGISGAVMHDYLYISRLWVDSNYRGRKIAWKLVDFIEKEAKDNGIKRSYLGTATFQAKDFYIKKGYEVRMIIKDCPKGFEDFVMVKML